MTGTVTQVNGKDNSFTISANGREATFSAKTLRVLPKVGETIDVTYTQTAGGPMEALSAQLARPPEQLAPLRDLTPVREPVPTKEEKPPPPPKPKEGKLDLEKAKIVAMKEEPGVRRMAAPPKTMTGTVTQVNGKDNSFTISANGREATFSAKTLRVLPKVGETIDVTYTQTQAGLKVTRAYQREAVRIETKRGAQKPKPK
jgi:hypothetical protein